MSTGICVLPAGMTSPSRNFGPVSVALPECGVSSMYCSPMAERLCTDAVTSEGIAMPDFSESTARTPFGVTSTDLTLPTSLPR